MNIGKCLWVRVETENGEIEPGRVDKGKTRAEREGERRLD